MIEQLIAAAPTAAASFYRTSHGAEVDLVLEIRSGETWVIEVKLSSAPKMNRGFTTQPRTWVQEGKLWWWPSISRLQ